MQKHLKKHWRSWVTAAACVIVFSIVAAESDVFQECMNRSYYESSDHEPPKGLAVIVSQLGWTKTCSGEFFVKDGEAITAFFTLVLGLATIGLWISTRELWKSGEKQSVAIANQSARMSEMATAAGQQVAIIAAQTDIQKKQHAIGRLEFLAVHRPRLRIRHVTLDERAEPLGFIPWDHGDEIKGSLIVVNAGGTKATIIESRYRIYFSKIGLPAGEAPYDTAFHNLLMTDQELGVGESCAIPLKDKIEMWGDNIPTEDGRTLRRFEQEGWTVYVMGQIKYRDEGGAERFMGFCRKRMRNGRYRPVKSPDYEYED